MIDEREGNKGLVIFLRVVEVSSHGVDLFSRLQLPRDLFVFLFLLEVSCVLHGGLELLIFIFPVLQCLLDQARLAWHWYVVFLVPKEQLVVDLGLGSRSLLPLHLLAFEVIQLLLRHLLALVWHVVFWVVVWRR